MSAPSVRRSRRRGWLLATFASAVGLFFTIGAGNAFAFSCTQVGDDVVLNFVNETVTLAKGNLSAITANGVPCGAATTSNTETIFVVVDNSLNGPFSNLIIDEGGGRFEPGVNGANGVTPAGSTESPGSLNEIEFVLFDADADVGTTNTVVDTLTILGNAAADTINVGNGNGVAGAVATPDADQCDDADPVVFGAFTIGDAAADEVGLINLNGDDDADICIAENVVDTTLFVDQDTGVGILPVVDLDNLVIGDLSLAVLGRGGNDVITGKGGLDTGAPVPDIGLVLDGGDGDDSIQGGEDDDLLIGGAGNDVIDGDADSVTTLAQFCGAFISFASGQSEGFGGGDIVDYSGSTGPITADLDPNEAHPGSATGDGTDVLQNIEGLIGSPGNDTLSGDNADNAIAGGAGDDLLAGDAGDDCVFGNDGNDTFDENEGTSGAQGGTGTTNGSDLLLGQGGLDDTVTYSARTTRINVYLEALQGGLDITTNGCFVQGPFIFDDGADLDGDGLSVDDENDCIFLDTENAITGSGNDLMVASFINNRADNEFTGNGGNDLMDGGAGNDTFHEGSAANGSDDMDGGTGEDTCDYSARTNGVSVNLDAADNDGEAGEGDNCGGVVNFTPPGQEEGDPINGQDVEDVLGGSGNDVLTGSDEANKLSGNAGNDTISGNGGTDALNGGDGDDTISGGGGNDAIDGGGGTDTVDYGSAPNGVVVNLTTGTASGDGTDTITGAENASGSSFTDSLRGTSGNDVLNGRSGNDAIQGLGGDDTINGGAGNDELGGGADNDNVSGGNGRDTIRGGGGDDTLSGGPAPDTIIGGAGDDTISGGAGADDMRGGPGTDRCNPGSPGFAGGDRATGCES